jgi:diguanylate cyclase (GGDEF)-like protein
MRQLITYKSPILDHRGELLGTVGIARNVTDVLNMKEEFEIVLEHLPFALLFYGNNGKILSVNKIFEERFDTNRLDIIGQIYHHWTESVFMEITGHGQDKLYRILKNTKDHHNIIKVHKHPVFDVFNNITGYFCIFFDITSELTLHETLVRRANTDYLTGLYNRRYLYETKKAILQNDFLCILYIDLDDFKIINDRFGHQEGDQVLVMIARSLLNLFSDHKVYRLGGDEFLVLITQHLNLIEIQQLALEFLKYIEKLKVSFDEDARLSASIGIATDADASVDFDELLKRGDAALYKAKQNGKNRYCVWENELFI